METCSRAGSLVFGPPPSGYFSFLDGSYSNICSVSTRTTLPLQNSMFSPHFLRPHLFEVLGSLGSKDLCLDFWSPKICPTNSSSILTPIKELSPLLQKAGAPPPLTVPPLAWHGDPWPPCTVWSSLLYLLCTAQLKSLPGPPAPSTLLVSECRQDLYSAPQRITARYALPLVVTVEILPPSVLSETQRESGTARGQRIRIQATQLLVPFRTPLSCTTLGMESNLISK